VTSVAAIVLAAGQSTRFRAAGGGEETKLVATLDDKPIVRRVVETAIASRAHPVVVVVGHARGAVEAALAGLPATLAYNPDYATGLASSLRTGLTATPLETQGVLILLGDMPGVEAGLIDALIDAFEAQRGALAVAPVKDGRRGNPVLLARALFDRARLLKGDEGARRLLGALPKGHVVEIAALGSDVVFDIDTPSDLADARRNQGHRPSSRSD
jgi:molybdenum cofactor cytidylyltransferase